MMEVEKARVAGVEEEIRICTGIGEILEIN